ncbi:hypothetical protein SAMN04489742_0774 [Arthrobacter crystallopoietes]|uniref:DUF6318 domain-containing protein n=1 Tax=Crystallibacter crystallopoietes TaxID=37928 RepID=A0A1H1A695_9MICC|nr:DUF6318 family protein [Arthrobacter crystallopoietes]SDQ35182.1 hypothetical protein SAMN04489742_0774 [Arthrobacter crystallopoietes]
MAALGLTACGGDAEGEPGSSASPAATSAAAGETATPTPTPSATPEYKPATANGPAENVPVPQMPELASEESKEGLEAFTLYWYDLLNYAYESGDLAPLEAVTEDSCLRCQDVGKVIADWHSEGRWLVGGKVEIDGTGTDYVEDSAGRHQIAVQLVSNELRYYLADGTLHEKSTESDMQVDVLVARYESGRWLTLDVGVSGSI